MKRILPVVMLLMVVSGFVLGEENRVIVPVNVSLFPAHGMNNPLTVVNNVQINVGVGYADELNGVALGVVSIIGDEVRGMQAGVVNLAGGDLIGAQAICVNIDVASSLKYFRPIPLGLQD